MPYNRKSALSVSAVVLTVVCLAASSVHAQDDVAERYAGLRSQWDTINGRLDELASAFRDASPAERETIRSEYGELVQKVNELLPPLRTAAVAVYKLAPNRDQALMQLLVGLVANDVRGDRFEDAAGLAQLLIDNGCPEKGIYGLAGVAAYCRDDFERAEQYLNIAKEANALPPEAPVYLTDVAFAKKLWAKEQQIRAAEAAADNLPRVLLKTSKGDIVVELYENEAPQAVGSFISLVEKGYYNGLLFHRVLPGFMAQAGCPEGTGTGGPGYNIYCECYEPNHRKHFRGCLSMAHAGRNTGGSQFFLTFRRTSHLDGRHTIFGRVIKGMELLADLQRIDPQAPGPKPEADKILQATVIRKRDHVYAPTKVQ